MAEEYELIERGPTKDEKPAAKVDENLPEVVVNLVGTVEDVPAGTIKNAIVKLGVTDQALAEVKVKVLEALSKWDGTKSSYEAVRRVRLDLVPKRVAIEKEAKEGRAEALAVQRLWIGAEKTFTSFYSDLEDQLAAKEFEYTEAIRKVAEEKARIERERVQGLFNQLKAFEWPGNELIVAQMTDQQFTDELGKVKAQFEEVQALRKAEAERKAQAEKDAAELAEKNRVEAERLAQERRRMEAEDLRRRAETEKLERDKVAAETQRQKALAEVEEARQRGLAEVAEAKAKVEREALEAKQKAERQEVERKAEADRVAQTEKDARELAERKALEERQRAMAAPDRDKVGIWASKIEAVLKEAPLALAEPLSVVVVGIHRDISVAVDVLKEAAK